MPYISHIHMIHLMFYFCLCLIVLIGDVHKNFAQFTGTSIPLSRNFDNDRIFASCSKCELNTRFWINSNKQNQKTNIAQNTRYNHNTSILTHRTIQWEKFKGNQYKRSSNKILQIKLKRKLSIYRMFMSSFQNK